MQPWMTRADHWTAGLHVYDATSEHLAAKVTLSEDEMKSRFSDDLLEAVRERRTRLQQTVTTLEMVLDEIWQVDPAHAPTDHADR